MELEADFAERSIRLLKIRHRVRSSQAVRDRGRRTMPRRTPPNCRLRMANEALVCVKDRAHSRRVNQGERGKWIVRIGINGRNALWLLRTGVARALELRNPQQALVEQCSFI